MSIITKDNLRSEAVNTASRYAATEAQLEVWLSSTQSVEANCAYNEISSLIFNGKLDVQRLMKSIDLVVARHASLRSTFSEDGQEVVVHNDFHCEVDFVDFTSDLQHGIEQAVGSVVQRQAATPFDLVHGPLFRCVLQKTSEEQHRLTIAAHHLVMDGWSLALFCKDLGHIYDELDSNQFDTESLPPVNDYRDYAREMENYFVSEQGQADEAYWLNQFADRIPVLDLPTEKTRPSLRTYFGRRYDHHIKTELVERIRKVGAKSGCSLFNVMLAAFNAYVARISGQDDFCIGIPTAGQAALDQPNLMGHCVNTIPLRTNVDTSKTFVDYLKFSRKSLLDAFDHQRYSYGTLLRKLAPPRDPSRPPMLNVSFNIDPIVDVNELGFSGVDVELIIEPRSFENFEWFINGVIQNDQSIELQVQYNADLYTSLSMRFYLSGFESFLNEICDNPNAAIADLNAMSVDQRQQVLVDWNATEADYPASATLHSEFSRQAEESPNDVAVVFHDQSFSYTDVEAQSNRVARYLKSQGISPGDLVGICVERSSQMLIYLYGIMKAGAGYVPLDPAYPSDRLQYMCEHSKLKLIVTESELSSRVSEFNKPIVAIDAATEDIERLDASAINIATKPSDICYVIYTSGSTGKPKGVEVPHGAVVNFLYAMRETPGFSSDDSVLAITTLSFDIAVLELYLPTIFGGTVVIADTATSTDGKKLSEEVQRHDISLLQATPATWRMLIQSGWNGKPNLKALCGGEPMPQDLVEPLLSRCGKLWNMYGPTETTVWSAAYQITNSESPILIGKPIGNTQIYLLDTNGNEVPVGCEGEVHIGGAGVTLGYINQPELTAERFVDHRYRNPFANYVNERLYKTGDLAKYCFDGNIQFLRRNDKQVKVRGFRIELGEVENNIASHEAVQQVVVVVREDTAGDARLVAYLIASNNKNVSSDTLRAHLLETVPHYMVPQHFVFLDAMPQTNNGKIDYQALPAPRIEPSSQPLDDALVPTTKAEKYLADVWKQTLDIEDAFLNDSFFDIGGHSLLVMRVIKEVREKTGIQLSPQDFLLATLEQMATQIEDSWFFEQPQAPESLDETLNDSHSPNEKDESEIGFKENVVPVVSTSPDRLFRKLTDFWN